MCLVSTNQSSMSHHVSHGQILNSWVGRDVARVRGHVLDAMRVLFVLGHRVLLLGMGLMVLLLLLLLLLLLVGSCMLLDGGVVLPGLHAHVLHAGVHGGVMTLVGTGVSSSNQVLNKWMFSLKHKLIQIWKNNVE